MVNLGHNSGREGFTGGLEKGIVVTPKYNDRRGGFSGGLNKGVAIQAQRINKGKIDDKYLRQIIISQYQWNKDVVYQDIQNSGRHK